MVEKVKKLEWSKSVESALVSHGFTSEIVEEIKAACTVGRGEIYRIGEMTIITRVEMLSEKEHEVVWMATYGKGFKKHVKLFVESASRAGAKFIRFHVASDERAVVRAWRCFKPVEVSGWAGAYRCKLEAVK